MTLRHLEIFRAVCARAVSYTHLIVALLILSLF